MLFVLQTGLRVFLMRDDIILALQHLGCQRIHNLYLIIAHHECIRLQLLLLLYKVKWVVVSLSAIYAIVNL